jgi:hypothetical protein
LPSACKARARPCTPAVPEAREESKVKSTVLSALSRPMDGRLSDLAVGLDHHGDD